MYCRKIVKHIKWKDAYNISSFDAIAKYYMYMNVYYYSFWCILHNTCMLYAMQWHKCFEFRVNCLPVAHLQHQVLFIKA